MGIRLLINTIAIGQWILNLKVLRLPVLAMTNSKSGINIVKLMTDHLKDNMWNQQNVFLRASRAISMYTQLP